MSSDVVTISNPKIGESKFGVVSIVHVKTLDTLSTVKEGEHSRHFNAIFKTKVLQNLAGSECFPYVFCVLVAKLVIDLIACEGNKVVTVSSMQKEHKLGISMD